VAAYFPKDAAHRISSAERGARSTSLGLRHICATNSESKFSVKFGFFRILNMVEVWRKRRPAWTLAEIAPPNFLKEPPSVAAKKRIHLS